MNPASFFPFVKQEESTPEILVAQAAAYFLDAWQRQLLFFDLLRRRGDAYLEQKDKDAPEVLHFRSAVILDGRELKPAANYRLLQILPDAETSADPKKRPFVVFDPRAGQGPGIGGFKKDSEIGIALSGGHPVYFVSFLVKPVSGQTIEDVCAVCARFVAEVAARHPEADKPCLIGNCQAGWQIALMSAVSPNLAGVLILAGAPLSYWEGVRGQSPSRYTAGLVGGSWLDAFLSDLGGGVFDGAWLVQAFEAGNPVNTLWKKPHGVYAKIDTEAQRFLDFERWWGTPVLMGGDEMQFIADELFIGNHLTQGKLHFSDGRRADLRNIKSPIVIFCSRGDDITPPQQALGWITNLYAADEDIVARGQTIVYAMHDKIGHLGLFVSSSVVTKEHLKFISNIDMIESLPPGLYEASFLPKNGAAARADLATGDYVVRFEKRGLADIRALGGNDADDDTRFEAVARFSQNLQGLYSTFVSPFVRAAVTGETAEALRQMHPLRASFSFFSGKNPWLAALTPLVDDARRNRRPVAENNVFWQMQETFGRRVEESLLGLNALTSRVLEAFFLQIYSAPLLQAALGLRTVKPFAKLPPDRDVLLEEVRQEQLAKLMEQIDEGGLVEATVRGLLYVTRARHAIDERAFRMLGLLREQSGLLPSLGRGEYRRIVRQQYMMLFLDEEKAIKAIPLLLDRADDKESREAMKLIHQVFRATGPLSPEEEKRLSRLEKMFAPAHATPRRRASDRRKK